MTRRQAHIPAPVSSFLGRTADICAITAALEAARLVTLTGAPGIGKTSLALEVAGALAERHADGARLVELAALDEPRTVERAVASALLVAESSGESLTEVLVSHLHERDLLLVLDNCEHLVTECARLAETLLRGCPRLRILATSRQPLVIAGEHVRPVPPLSLPAAAASPVPVQLMEYDAVRLFVERAAAAVPGFTLDADTAPAVAEICRRLDGIPLAIELAAARVEVLAPDEIARRLDDRFALLRTVNPVLLPRHRTLLGAVEWSHELLSEPERAVLRRLSVFAGGLGLDAAEAVCAADGIERDGVLDLLGRLVARSLVVADTANSCARYRLLETIRAYAAERLEEADETARTRAAHARYYVALAERAEPDLTGPDQQHWLARLEIERENLAGALRWSLSRDEPEPALRLAAALVLFWRVRCHFTEGRNALRTALAAAGPRADDGLRAKALWGAGFMTLMTGDPERAIPALEESLSMFGDLDDRRGCARALLLLGNVAQYEYKEPPLPLLERSATLAQEADDTWCLAHALAVAGFENWRLGDLSAARTLLERSLAVARAAGERQSLRIGLLGMGGVAVHQGDYTYATSLLEEAVSVSRELGEDYALATALLALGHLALGQGRVESARELAQDALRLSRRGAPPGSAQDMKVFLGHVAHTEGDRHRAHALLDEAPATRDDPRAMQWLGELEIDEGEVETGRHRLERCRDATRASGNRLGHARALYALGELACADRDVRRAAALLHEALELQHQAGALPELAATLEAVAGLTAAMHRHQHAARLMGAAQALRERGGYARDPWRSSGHDADIALIREGLLDGEFEAAFAQGARLSLDEAVVQAAKGRRRRMGPSSGWGAVTDAERQVAALVAEGLTNPEIAERLFVTRGTVKNHLSHIFARLGVSGRRELEREYRRQYGKPSGAELEPPRGGRSGD